MKKSMVTLFTLSAFMININLYAGHFDENFLLKEATALHEKINQFRLEKEALELKVYNLMLERDNLTLERDNLRNALVESILWTVSLRNPGKDKLNSILDLLSNPENSINFLLSYLKTEILFIDRELSMAHQSDNSNSTLALAQSQSRIED